ncbi:MAG: PHP domain-containing protein [Thermoanaerobaculia bacterium]|nr:PHP domain-containing protein [Thermoanaerobaculia bacterium]
MRFADLHLHTVLSDGRRTPTEIVERAAEQHLDLIAITDHDHTGAYAKAFDTAIRLGVTLVTGVELSVAWRGIDLHLLAFAFDPDDEPLQSRLGDFRDARDRRGERMVEKLAALGLPIRLERVHEIAGAGSLGRPHIGQALIETGVCGSMEEAFDRYLQPGRPGFVPKARLAIDEALELVRNAGGLTSIAHPVFYPEHRRAVIELLDLGVDGVEVLHPEMPPELTTFYDDLCVRMGKMRTGGSDDHGFEDRKTIGSIRTPVAWIGPIIERAARLV